MQSTALLRCLIWTAAAAVAGSCVAQVQQPPGTMPDGRQVRYPAIGSRSLPPGSPAPHSPAPGSATPSPTGNPGQPNAAADNAAGSPVPLAPQLPPSLLDKPPQPAKVVLTGGELSVEADNSSLHAILDAIETTSGMTVDGFGKDQRIFGQYGPGNPRDILSSLLDGAGYNILMVGATDAGTPRTVLLTQRNNASPTPSVASNEPQDEDQDSQDNNPPEPVNPIVRPPLNSGPPEVPDQNGRPKSPTEILQEMQRLRSQQQDQQQPQ